MELVIVGRKAADAVELITIWQIAEIANCTCCDSHMLKPVSPLQLDSHALHAHSSHIEQSSSLTGMYSNLPEMVPDTSPAWGAVALFIGLAGLKGLSLSCPGAPGSAFSLHV